MARSSIAFRPVIRTSRSPNRAMTAGVIRRPPASNCRSRTTMSACVPAFLRADIAGFGGDLRVVQAEHLEPDQLDHSGALTIELGQPGAESLQFGDALRDGSYRPIQPCLEKRGQPFLMIPGSVVTFAKPVRDGCVQCQRRGGSFPPKFKRKTVALLESSGRPLMQVATEARISPSMLRDRRAMIRGGTARSRAATPAHCHCRRWRTRRRRSRG
ncbi:hypothetical protein QE361_001274 [Sphingomonas sp. SORGH_AS802]|nr:hypothetical protein [Sphingomonas sp. SORGH_AS_0438]MDR6134299.1 hypothetical protein [Sphingomonas sp. SORGH_AS_0802]